MCADRDAYMHAYVRACFRMSFFQGTPAKGTGARDLLREMERGPQEREPNKSPNIEDRVRPLNRQIDFRLWNVRRKLQRNR